MSTAVAELLASLHLDDEIQCDATVNQLRCCAPSDYRVTFECCGPPTRTAFVCQTCFVRMHLSAYVSCLYCDRQITEWRVI